MTIQELLELAAIDQWRIDDDRYVRNQHSECPICAVANRLSGDWRYFNGEWHSAAAFIGLPHDDAEAIVVAADRRGKNELRAQMIATLITNRQ